MCNRRKSAAKLFAHFLQVKSTNRSALQITRTIEEYSNTIVSRVKHLTQTPHVANG